MFQKIIKPNDVKGFIKFLKKLPKEHALQHHEAYNRVGEIVTHVFGIGCSWPKTGAKMHEKFTTNFDYFWRYYAFAFVLQNRPQIILVKFGLVSNDEFIYGPNAYYIMDKGKITSYGVLSGEAKILFEKCKKDVESKVNDYIKISKGNIYRGLTTFIGVNTGIKVNYVQDTDSTEADNGQGFDIIEADKEFVFYSDEQVTEFNQF